jgi:hypothetical protein
VAWVCARAEVVKLIVRTIARQIANPAAARRHAVVPLVSAKGCVAWRIGLVLLCFPIRFSALDSSAFVREILLRFARNSSAHNAIPLRL